MNTPPQRIVDRLQPALLDRLCDDDSSQRQEPSDRTVMSRKDMREAVLRDLGWLFNSMRPPEASAAHDEIDASPMPEADKQRAHQRVIDFAALPPAAPPPEHAPSAPDDGTPRPPHDPRPHAQRSVINFGLPALSGLTSSSVDAMALEAEVRRAILDFEPRILPDTLVVHKLDPQDIKRQYNQIDFRITGQLWAQPVPLEMLLQTHVDLETGRVELIEKQR